MEKFILKVATFTLLLFCLTTVTNAADLRFTPVSGSYKIGDVFSVSVLVSSSDKAVNAIQSNIIFPVDKLTLVSLAKVSQGIGLWVQEPTFSNTNGTASFEGIILNPGYQGAGANLVTLTFRAKAEGNASLKFSQGAVLANDGLGTNVLTNLGTANFVIGPTPALLTTPVPVAPTVPISASLPSAINVKSSTHPEPDSWYANSDPEFNWSLPKDVTAVRLLYDKYPSSQPSVFYNYRLAEKSLSDVKDGSYYFHAQARNSAGWGPVSHFRFQIDTAKPESFEFEEIPRSDNSETSLRFSLKASDNGSGIKEYEIKVGDDESIIIPAQVGDEGSGETIYQADNMPSGKHTIIARAIDFAGNYLTDYLDIEVESINPPLFTEYPSRIAADEVATIKGRTYLNSEVTIYYGRNAEQEVEQKITSDDSGEFAFSFDAKSLKNGVYLFSGIVTKPEGAKSLRSDPIIIVVERSWLNRVSNWTVNFLVLFIPMLALLLILILLILSSWRQAKRYKYQVRKEVGEAQTTLEKAFDILREDLQEHLKTLEKTKISRALTDEETRIMHRLKSDLNEAEKLVKKEIKDIAP